MRIIISMLLLIGILSSCDRVPPVDIPASDPALTQKTSGILIFGQSPFSGYLTEYYETGQLKSKKGYLNGWLQGESTAYYADGAVKEQRYYTNGEKDGRHVGYYESGAPRFELFFEEGQNVGNHKTWYENGQIAQDLNYVDGQPFGAQRVWRPDGKLRSNYVVREDGRRYGLVGLKRCKNIDVENEQILVLSTDAYAK